MKYNPLRLIACSLLSWALLAPLAARAQTSWNGSVSADWSTAANWTAGVPSSTVAAIIGDANFTGANQPSITAKSVCKSLVLGNGVTTSILTVNHSLTVLGDITIGANGAINHNSPQAISLAGNWNNAGTYTVGQNRATITFSGSSQILSGPTTFNRLTINAGSRTLLNANINVTGQLTVSGTLDPGESPTFAVAGNAKLVLRTGGTLLVKAPTFAGNYGLSGAKSLAAASTVDYAATTTIQTVANNLTYGTLRISGGLTKTLGGNLPALNAATAGSGNIVVVAGTLDLSTFSADRATGGGTTLGGTLSVANGATLKIGGTHTFPANYQTHSLGASSTVEYSGTSQTVSAEAYGNLGLSSGSGAAVKTMPSSAMTIAGDLTSSLGAGTSLSFTAAAAITVQGNVSIGPSTTFNGGAFAISVGGNWSNNGAFNGGTGSLTLSGAGAVISGNGANNFNNLTIAGAGTTASASTSLAVAGNLATSGAGTFAHLAGGPGSVAMNGASKVISGIGITFNHLAIAGSISTAASLTIGGNLSVSGALSATAGTITMTGPANTVSGSGSIIFNGLNVRGAISTSVNFSIKSDFSVSGSFTATGGTASFVGTSTLSGAANLFNVTLNGTKLQLGASSVLGIAGTFSISGGAFDVATTTPNTVNYNGPAAQSILTTTYDNLSFSTGGTKTASGALTVLGNQIIGSGTTFNASSFTYSLYGNWINHGSFVPGSATVQLLGGLDASISGATTFATLTVNKSSPNNVLTLYNDLTVSLLNMSNGRMLTGPNTVTITSNRTGNGIILGTITRTHSFATGSAYAFESPNNTINFSTMTGVSSVTVQAAKGPVTDFPYGSSVNRQYAISLTAAGPYAATLRLHYEDSDLNGNLKSALQLLHFDPPWTVSGVTARDTLNDWAEQSALTDITGRWVVSDNPKVATWNGSVSTAWETAANWDATAGSATLPPGANEIAAIGTTNFTHQPAISSAVAVRSVFFGSAMPATLTLGSGGALITLGNIQGNWTADATHTIQVGAQTLTVGGDLQLSDGTNGHAINLALDSGSVAVSGVLTESGGANLTVTGSGTLQLAGDFIYDSGNFSAGSGTAIYSGSGVQAVAGGITYNQLSFAKPAGTATLTNSAVVSGRLVLTNGGTFLVNAALSISNHATIYTNATLDGGGATISVGGNWTNNGTFTPGTGTVVFFGTNSQSIASTTFNNLTINKSTNVAMVAGNLIFNGDLNVSSGTLDLSRFSAARSLAGGTLALAASTTLRVGSSYPSAFDTTILDPISTVEYYGTNAQVVAPSSYGNLYFSNGGAAAKTLAGDSTVAGDLVINTGATLDGSTFSLNVQGNWTNNGFFTASASSITLSGSSRNLSGATTFNNLSVPGSYTASSDTTVLGTMNLSGSYAAGGANCIFAGDFLNTGTLTGTGAITFSGTGSQRLGLNAGFQSAGTVSFNGSVAPTFNSLSVPTLQNVNINNSGGVAPDIGWVIRGNFVVNGAALFNGGSATHIFDGNFSNLGTVTSSGTLVFAPASAATVALGGPAFSSSAVILGGTGQISFGAGPQPFNSLSVTNSYSGGVTPAGNWTLSGDLFIGPSNILSGGVGLTHTIAGDLSDDGTFDGGTSLVILTGAADPVNGSSIAGQGSTTFDHLTVAGTVSANANFNVAGNFTNNGTFDGTASIVTLAGNGPFTVGGSTTPTPFDTLVIAKSSAPATLAVNLSALTSLTIASGTLDALSFAITQIAGGGSLAIHAGSILRIGGASTLPVFSAYAFDPAGTVEYYGAVAQTIAPVNYGSLLSSSTGPRVLPSGSTIGIAGSFLPGTNPYTTTGSTINYNGASAQTVAPFNYYHLASSSSGPRVLPSSGTVGVAGTFSPGANSYTIAGSTVDFNGAAQSIPPFTFNNLSITGSGTKSLAGDITVSGTLALEAGTLADAGFTLTARADVMNTAVHTGSGKLLLTGGAAPHSLSGGGSFANLELNDPIGASLDLTNLTVNGTLTFTDGLINTTTNIVIIGSTGAVARVSGHVFGNLQKSVGSGAAVTNTFEIGDAVNYTPVTVLLSNVTAAGKLTARTSPADHPDIVHSGLAPTRNVNRYWTITNSGTAFSTYDATFNFVPSDLDVLANPTNFIVAKLNGATWTLPAIGARASTSIQATAMTSFSDYAVGEPVPTNAPTITAQPQSLRANLGANATFTVAATGQGVLGYQWQLNGATLAGATTSALSLTNVRDTNSGFYSVVVDNGLSVTSSNALLTINHPPILAPIPGQTVDSQTNLIVSVSASDPDAGLLTFSLPSAPPGVSISSAGVITWTNPGPDGSVNLVTVTVADDGSPPLTASQTFAVVVLPVSAGRIISIQLLNDGDSFLTIAGVADQPIWIQATPTLSSPPPWINIATNTIGANGLAQFEDVQTTNNPIRFYRLALPR